MAPPHIYTFSESDENKKFVGEYSPDFADKVSASISLIVLVDS